MYKILIIEDEKWIRIGLLDLIDPAEIPVAAIETAADAEQARQAFSAFAPDLVLSDIRLPGGSGLELCREFYQMRPQTRFILITGYESFEYARESLAFKAVDYLLKPVRKEALVAALRRAIEEIEHERYAGLSDAKQEILGTMLAAGYLSGEIAQIARLESPLGAYFGDHPQFALAALVVDGQSPAADRLPGVLGEGCVWFWGKPGELIWIRRPVQDPVPDVVLRDQLRDVLADQLHLTAGDAWCLVLGARYQGFADVPQAFGEMRRRIGSRCQGDAWIPAEKAISPWARDRILEQRAALLAAAATFDLKQIKRWIQTMQAILQDGTAVNCALVSESLNDLYRQAAELWPTLDISAPTPADADLPPLSVRFTVDQMLADFALRLQRLISRLTARLRGLDSRAAVAWMRGWIEENIAQPLSLRTIAAELYVSEQYLASLFRQQNGLTFGEYLTRARMQRAAELLADSTLRVGSIADAVGYPDQHYFSRAFRRYHGCSPVAYRERTQT